MEISFPAVYAGVAFLVAVVSLMMSALGPDAFSFHTIYYELLAVLIAVVAALSWRFDQPRRGLQPRDWASPLLVFILALVFRLWGLSKFSVWLDEDSQAKIERTINLVRGASYGGQPPLDFYFGALNLSLFGMHEWGIRLFPCLFGAFAALGIFYLVRSVSRNQTIAWLAAAYVILQPWLIRYSQEGRPVSTAIFFEVIWLQILVRFFRERLNVLSWLTLLSATLLFFLSIAFQPLIVVLAIGFGLFSLVGSGAMRPKILGYWAAAFVGMLLFAPILRLDMEGAVDALNRDFTGRPWLPLTREVFETLLGNQGIVVAVLILAALFLRAARAFRRGRLSARDFSVSLGPFAVLLFIPLFAFAYSLAIGTELYPRYYLTAIPLVVLAVAVSLAECARSWPKKVSAIFVAVAIALIGGELFSLPRVYSGEGYMRWNADWRHVFEIFRAEGKPGDLAYYYDLTAPERYEVQGFLADQFYYRPDEARPVALNSELDRPRVPSSKRMLRAEAGGAEPASVFLVFARGSGAEDVGFDAFFRSLPASEVQESKLLWIVKLSAEGDWLGSVGRFFDSFVNAVPPTPRLYRVLDTLLRIEERRKEYSQLENDFVIFERISENQPKLAKLLAWHQKKLKELQAPRG
jgi:4-amino-4-deoxy-L-arabinose transferase-like glycosyltransferase